MTPKQELKTSGTVVKNFKRQVVVSTPTNKKHGCYQTVIVADNDRRTVGLCVNRPVFEIPCVCGECLVPPAPLFLGGPEEIDQRYFFLHDQPGLARSKDKLFDGVYLSCPRMVEQFDPDAGHGKMITGFCQWDAGELATEVRNGMWLVDQAPDPALFLNSEPKKLWKDMTPRHYSFRFSEN